MVFSPAASAQPDDPVKLPCGQCIGCRLDRSRQWAIRCVHEASLYERNCFITLTFDNENLPKSGSLDVRDFQLFMKKLRKRFRGFQEFLIDGELRRPIRFFHCGEYGEKHLRPHYHACLFNFDFEDRKLWSVRAGIRLYVSEELQSLWPFGFSTVGDVTFESAAYVARHITKKVTGDRAEEHYQRFDPSTGEVFDLEPEYTTMSRRPGIGKPWLTKYMSDVYPADRVVLRGRELRPPKYYDGIFELENPEGMEDIKFKRSQALKLLASDMTYERLSTKERIQYLRFQRLKRGYENAE